MADNITDTDLGSPVVDKPIEDGVYSAVLREARKVPNKFEPGRNQIEFRWEILDDEAKGRRLTSWANLVPLTAKAKLRKHAEALYGRPLRPEEALKTSDLIGREARLVLESSYSGDGQSSVTKVTNVIPMKPIRSVDATSTVPF